MPCRRQRQFLKDSIGQQRLTSSLTNLSNSLLNGQTGCPSNDLLTLKFILLLVEAVQSVAHDVEKTLGGTNKTTKGKHDGSTLDCEEMTGQHPP